jgi:CheY-like chemotaxis protein
MLQKSLPAEAAELQACQAQRMEIVGQLTGGVVHDFNNILTVIAGTIEILQEAVADRPELAAIAGLIAEAAARGSDLTAQLLAFSRGQPSQPRDVDVNALLVDAARLLRPTLGEQIEIDSVPATGVPDVLIDPSRLMAAILDLAIMARDAMPDGGKLTLQATSDVTTAADADSEAAAGDYVGIAVSACGYGISADHPDRAFADLGMIRDFIAQSGGHIRVCREAGRGTSVEIGLRRAAGLAHVAASDAGETRFESGGEVVLVVEDDAMVRKYVVAQVQSLGYLTFAAADASEALTIIDTGRKIDLLFTDIMMPGSINGRQLAIDALNRRPSLKVLYTSGYAENALVHDRCLDAGALLLAKPYRKADLARMIRIALAA